MIRGIRNAVAGAALGALLGLLGAVPASAFETVTFPSEDGLPITADLYRAKNGAHAPFIVLFHQARWSRGEYREIAPRLVELGFGCLAVDQRSGDAVNGVANETARRAAKRGQGVAYVDALPDLRAALRIARERYARGALLAWGSSYSAALALRLAGDEPALVDGVLAFAPGEYFGRAGKPAGWVRAGAASIADPVFVTSARSERGQWQAIFDAIPGEDKVAFVPETAGQHGARALWRQFPEHTAYWAAVERFLARYTADAR